MTPGVTTWVKLGTVDGNLLLVINSPDGATETVEAVLAALERHLHSSVLHVIATPAWQTWLAGRGIVGDRVLMATDEEGRDIELNHFLESPAAVLWSVPKQFRCFVGSDAHSVYNEEVKDIFEQRVLLLLGEGRLLAHTLPNPYVYVFDAAHLLERCGRELKVRQYERTSRALIDDLYRLWQTSGSPSTDDGPDFTAAVQVLEQRLGSAVMAFDEIGPIPLRHERITDAFVDIVTHFRSVLSEHDRRLKVMTDLHAERSEAVEIRERLLAELSAERVEAVNLRDKIIEDLHLQLEPWHRKLRRRWREKRD